MKTTIRLTISASLILCVGFLLTGCSSAGWEGYRGKPFQDIVYHGGPQKIPGRVQCAYYDFGGEGVAYHNTDSVNHGSGQLNPANGSYLNEFRMNEGVSTSYTKFHDEIDNNPYNLVLPPTNQLYVGWTVPGEWFNLTVAIQHAGIYTIDLLYTSNRGGTISLDWNGKALVPTINIISTRTDKDPLAWRQWHHWNVTKDLAQVTLPKGGSVLTVRVLTEGNMNLGCLEFRRK